MTDMPVGPAAPLDAARAAGHAAARVEEFTDAAAAKIAHVKPLLRGWLHTVTAPVALAAGLTLICLAPNAQAAWTAAVWTVTSVLLFGTSAIYHRGRWGQRTSAVLQRADHANIYLLIAGTYTPFAFLALRDPHRTALLGIVWGGALLGATFRVLWIDAPRWLYTPLYALLGFTALGFLPQLFDGAGVAAMTLTSVGGVIYGLGAVVYGLRWPGPNCRRFGFHEWFHACTVAAWTCQAVAVYLLVCRTS